MPITEKLFDLNITGAEPEKEETTGEECQVKPLQFQFSII
jgi:hypothetical protein